MTHDERRKKNALEFERFKYQKSAFEEKLKNHPYFTHFETTYSYYVDAGRADDGAAGRYITFQFGKRPYDWSVSRQFGKEVEKKSLVEHGPSAHFVVGATGEVGVFLYPTRSEGYGTKEDGIIFALRSDTTFLFSESSLDGIVKHSFRMLLGPALVSFRVGQTGCAFFGLSSPSRHSERAVSSLA